MVGEGERIVSAMENGPGMTLMLIEFETEVPEIVALRLVVPDLTAVKIAV